MSETLPITSRMPTAAHMSRGEGITGTKAKSATRRALCGTGESAAGGQSMIMYW
jgi:hypothetical protein